MPGGTSLLGSNPWFKGAVLHNNPGSDINVQNRQMCHIIGRTEKDINIISSEKAHLGGSELSRTHINVCFWGYIYVLLASESDINVQKVTFQIAFYRGFWGPEQYHLCPSLRFLDSSEPFRWAFLKISRKYINVTFEQFCRNAHLNGPELSEKHGIMT